MLYTPPGVPSHNCLRLLCFALLSDRPAAPEACTRYQKVISRSEMFRRPAYPNLLPACAEMCSATFNYFKRTLVIIRCQPSLFRRDQNPSYYRSDQPCLCLCLGFSQMILMEPFLLMTLHFSQIGFTDALTFILT